MVGQKNLDYYNSHYKHVNNNFDFIKYKETILTEHADILNKEKKILDLGCGTGFLLMALEFENYKRLYGVELDKNQFKKAQQNLRFAKVINTDAFEFLIKCKTKFDIIFLYDLLEHIDKERIIDLLKLINKKLNNGGYVVIKTPNANSPFFSSIMRYIDFTHVISFNNESICMVLRQAGFDEIKCRNQKLILSYKNLFALPIRWFGNFIIKIYLATYLGIKAFDMILDPNF